MGISATDIKLRKSQRLTDFSDGGGRMVAAEVVDGQLNNLFPDISTQDRVAGRVSMRKAFVHIDTANTDMLYGAVGVVIDPPEDDNVFMSMFSTGNYADTRTDARNRIENYITKGVESRYVLYGDHFIGQRSINVYCLSDAPMPEINETYCLSVEKAGFVPNVQYVRVEEIVSRTTQTFTDGSSVSGGVGEFQRDVIVLAITTALIFDFPGQEVYRYTVAKPPTRVRHTNVADASSYYSIKSLIGNPEAGDTTVKVDNPYIPLVPTTQAETPLVDVLAGMGALTYIEAGDAGSLTLSFTATFGAGVLVTRFLGNPMVKGTVTVVAGGTTLTDDGRGTLKADAESVWGGVVDYLAGTVSVSHSAGTGNTAVTVTATPAGPVLMQGYTDYIEITELNRQLNYVMQLVPLPYAGTVTIDYMALGKWIRLTDNSNGQLSGNPGQGSGSVNYATGSLIATLGALPDINSALVVSFGTGIVADRRDKDVQLAPPALALQVPRVEESALQPGSISVDYKVGGATQTATDASATGVLKVGGTVVGSVDYAAATVNVKPAVMPDVAQPVTVAATVIKTQSDTFVPASYPGGYANLNCAADIIPGSFQITWAGQQMVAADNPKKPSGGGGQPAPAQVSKPVTLKARDDGNGNIVCVQAGSAVKNEIIGTITYATGVATVMVTNLFANSLMAYYWEWVFDVTDPWRLRGPSLVAGLVTAPIGTVVNATWQEVGAPAAPVTVPYPSPGDPLLPPDPGAPPIVLPAPGDPTPAPVEVAPPAPIDLRMDLTPGTDDPIVPGSVRFVYRGKTYVDRSGALYHTIDPATGSGTYAGTVDYATGKVDIVKWELSPGANTLDVRALLVKRNEVGQQRIAFRTPGAPLRPGSFIFRAATLNGELLTATAGLNGDIIGDGVQGSIDWRTGFARLDFSYMVPVTGNEDASWYDPSMVSGSLVKAPVMVNPSTAYFGTVVFRNIPLNPSLLGLDPVRLPEDGRVVVFRPGQTVLVHHTQVTEVASPVAAQVVDLGRPNLTRVEVRDSVGVPILSSWYVIDKPAGTVTFTDPLNLTGYTLPVVIRDRIEDRVLVADAQITGEIAINRGLSHNYPAGGNLSTCLILGEANGSQDLQGRVENIFDQATWTAQFNDARIGDGTDAQYNDVVYPIEIDNANAITERWAIKFTGASNIEVIGEASGIIWSGNISTDCAPLNPRTGQPYFTIPKEGWGAGWSTGNVLRFNTVGGLAPVWFIRTTLAGEAEVPYDGFRYETIGDANP